MRNKTRPAGIALGLGLLASLLFLAGPAAADMHHHGGPSLGPNATDGSVTSGSARADNGSTASGDSVAKDGSVASGCSTAIHDSTASGGDCKPDHKKPHHKPDHKKPHHKADHGKKHHRGGVGGAAPAHAVEHRALAVTGSATGPLTAAAAGLLALGIAMVVLSSDRRRATLATQ